MTDKKNSSRPVRQTHLDKNLLLASSQISTPLENSHAQQALQAIRSKAFPIVGIGASADGLGSCIHFLQALSPDIEMAFVFIQHPSLKAERDLIALLSRISALPVTLLEEGTALTPRHVYLTPPRHYLTIEQGVARLAPRTGAPRLFTPIDHFLRTLAQDRQSNAIAVLFSGTSSDGALGVAAVKAAGGVTFAHSEASSHGSSYRAGGACASDAIDFLLSPPEIAQALNNFKPQTDLRTDEDADPHAALAIAPEVQDILLLLKAACGADLRLRQQPLLERWIFRRMTLHQLDSLKDYRKLLQQNPVEVQALYRDMVTKATGFFRDAEAFDAL